MVDIGQVEGDEAAVLAQQVEPVAIRADDVGGFDLAHRRALRIRHQDVVGHDRSARRSLGRNNGMAYVLSWRRVTGEERRSERKTTDYGSRDPWMCATALVHGANVRICRAGADSREDDYDRHARLASPSEFCAKR